MNFDIENGDLKEVFPDNFIKGKDSLYCNSSIFSAVSDFLSSLDSGLKYERAEKLFCDWKKKQGYTANDLSFVFSHVGNTDSRYVFTTSVLISPSRSLTTKKCHMTYVSEYTMEFKAGLFGFLLIPDGLNKMLPNSLVSDISIIKGVLNKFLSNSTSVNVLICLWVNNTPFSIRRLSPYSIPSDDFLRVLLNIFHSNFNELFKERYIAKRDVECSHTDMYFSRAYKWYKGGL